MIKIDISRALPVNALRYLVAFMPGLFFLFCVALGNPCLASHLIARLQVSIPLGQYATLFVAFFLAFVIGHTFINFVSLIQYLLQKAYGPWLSLKATFRERALLPLLNRLVHPLPSKPNSPQPKPRPRWLFNLRSHTLQQIYSPVPSARAAFRWWQAIATQLLRTRYGMKDDDFPPETSWQPLLYVLTTPTRQELRGYLIMIASHATGWSALAASRFAPALRTRWFYLFAFLLIGTGLIHDLTVADNKLNPLAAGTLHLRALMREFPKPEAEGTRRTEPEENNDEA